MIEEDVVGVKSKRKTKLMERDKKST